MDQEKIGKFILECRKKKKMTQEEFAEQIGVNARSVSRWGNGNCMPDMSLYHAICSTLDITINELLSGEYVDKKEYQGKFERNMINVVNNVSKKNKNMIRTLFNIVCITIILYVGFFIFLAFCQNYQFIQKYDKGVMKAEVRNSGYVTSNDNYYEKEVIFCSEQYGNIKTLVTTYEDGDNKVGVIFITFYRTIENMFEDRDEYDLSFVDLTHDKNNCQSVNIVNSNLSNEMRVYYTTEKFSKIAKLDNYELGKLIKKSNLLM